MRLLRRAGLKRLILACQPLTLPYLPYVLMLRSIPAHSDPPPHSGAPYLYPNVLSFPETSSSQVSVNGIQRGTLRGYTPPDPSEYSSSCISLYLREKHCAFSTSDTMPFVLSLYWILPITLLSYFAVDLIITKSLIRKYHVHPLVGSPSTLTPRAILNLIFARKAAHVLENGYRKVIAELQLDIRLMLTSAKFKDKVFQLVRGDGVIVILPTSLLDELSTLPASIASPNGALEQDLLGPYTGLDLILESRLHHSIVQRKLTPRLGSLTPPLENEVKAAFEDYFPTCDDWTEFTPYQVFGKISARLSGRALVGATFCRNPTWLDISFNYTENRASSS